MEERKERRKQRLDFTMNERFIEIAIDRGYNAFNLAKAFARRRNESPTFLGANRSAEFTRLRSIWDLKNVVSSAILQDFALIEPTVNIQWILIGKGEKYIKPYERLYKEAQEEIVNLEADLIEKKKMISLQEEVIKNLRAADGNKKLA